jgi:hypothetical protein
MLDRGDGHLSAGLVRQPGSIVFGTGARTPVPDLLPPAPGSVLICTDSRMAEQQEPAEIVSDVEERAATSVD